ncbi:MAG: hypothetical protein IKU85_06025 [Bacteroidaceae bacterium]|nr:hypothetical protein [Bacteroidaceae bacterium]
MMKKKVLYLHGFASAGSSGTAVQMRSHLYPMGASVLSPDIPVSPIEAMDMLRKMVEEERPDLIVATSMGALYAEQLYGTPRLLVNPSFHMARLLMLRGMGRQEFRNKRADGARDFKVDRPLIAEFQQVEKQSFSHIDAAEKGRVYGLFGLQDKKVNCQPDFKKHYGKDNLILFQGEHYLNGQVLGTVVMPLVEKLLFGE